ncbi:MAG: hypothetical protein RL249_192, partial [Actinomycetota bacterium]
YLQALLFLQPLSSPFHLERLRAQPLVFGPEGTEILCDGPRVIETLWAEAEHRSGCAATQGGPSVA